MKTVHFIANKARVVDYLMTPVRYNRKELLKRGYEVKLFYEITEESLSCDTLLLVSKPVFKILNEKKAVISEPSPTLELLRKARKYASKIIWVDSSDSTGITHFELLPYVDLYLKKHLLKDRSLYQKEFYGGRIFSDYYHKEFGVTDTALFSQFYPLDLNFSDKVDLCWNMGIGDVYHAFSKWTKLRLLFPDMVSVNYNIDYVDTAKDRTFDVFLRASSNWPRETVAFHRKELVRRLDAILARDSSISGSIKGQINLKEYRQRMQNSKITFGPFGWGELNIREYEALIFGCLLFRPDLSHMETWPDIFIDGETCIFYRWDFEDLEPKLKSLLNDDKKRVEIAQNGQEAFRNSISKEGMERFSDWFIQKIEKEAVINRN